MAIENGNESSEKVGKLNTRFRVRGQARRHQLMSVRASVMKNGGLNKALNMQKKVRKSNEKPFQWLAWIATVILILAASLASFVPALALHHYAFIAANTLWVIVGILWKENSLVVMNTGLTLLYIAGLIFNYVF